MIFTMFSTSQIIFLHSKYKDIKLLNKMYDDVLNTPYGMFIEFVVAEASREYEIACYTLI